MGMRTPRGWLIFLAASQDGRRSCREAWRFFAAGRIRNRHRTRLVYIPRIILAIRKSPGPAKAFKKARNPIGPSSAIS